MQTEDLGAVIHEAIPATAYRRDGAEWVIETPDGTVGARAALGWPEAELALPLTEPQPFPLHAIVRRVAPAYLAWLKRQDLREPDL
ncbi:hypothetical protein AB9K34_07380 [Sedimentitalea sp. XS_ASV28]|uniref:hypothetical protein n=1 Tax=Sedimentitalea sp. XS_ASV28 TaxID=3241296 RepID=UPI00351399BC